MIVYQERLVNVCDESRKEEVVINLRGVPKNSYIVDERVIRNLHDLG